MPERILSMVAYSFGPVTLWPFDLMVLWSDSLGFIVWQKKMEMGQYGADSQFNPSTDKIGTK